MTATQDDQLLRERMARLEGLLDRIGALGDPTIETMTREMVETVLEFHGVALARILDKLTDAGGSGPSILAQLADDELVASVLSLHNLHPQDLRSRVVAAIDSVRPLLASHGGSVTLLDVTAEGAVRLRLEGSCHGCPSSRLTLSGAIEEAIYSAAPEIESIQVEGLVDEAPPGNGFVSISGLVTSGNSASNGHAQGRA